MKLIGNYIKHELRNNKVIIGFECDIDFLNSIAFLKSGVEYQLDIQKPKGKKSIAQNNYLWSMLREICLKQDGDLRDLDNLYFNVLEFSGAKTYEITLLKEAYGEFKKTIRHTKILDEFIKDGNTYYVIQCFPGVSNYDSRELAKLLDYVIDYAERVGIDTTIYRK